MSYLYKTIDDKLEEIRVIILTEVGAYSIVGEESRETKNKRNKKIRELWNYVKGRTRLYNKMDTKNE